MDIKQLNEELEKLLQKTSFNEIKSYPFSESLSILNKNDGPGSPCPVLDIRRKAFSFLPLSMILVVGLS